MCKVRTLSIAALLAVVLPALTIPVNAQTLSVLYNFGVKTSDPKKPITPGILSQGRDDNLYGSTFGGGTKGLGTVFRITPKGTLTVLYNFDQVHGAHGFGLAIAADGHFYGTASAGGSLGHGALFRIGLSGDLTEIHNFTGHRGGATPYAAPIQGTEGTDGSFYGATYYGGQGMGTVYKVTASGNLTTLHSFDSAEGGNPESPLIQSADGNFYGTTYMGGVNQLGGVYKITPSGEFSELHSFDGNDGAFPNNLVLGNDGNFYGTTYDGGAGSHGVVFKITPAGVFAVLYAFNGKSDGGCTYAGLVQATDGNFYGATLYGGTNRMGTLYRISPEGGFTVLTNLDATTGSDAEVTMVQHTDGMLYGDTASAGAYGHGTFYGLQVGLEPFVSLLSAVGEVGRPVGILGQAFKGTKAVSFNGTPAPYKVISDNYLTTTVPNGATTGFVTVTTSQRKLKSNQKFRVLR